MKKSAMLIAVGLGITIDHHTTPSPMLGPIMSMAFVGTEGVSVIENLSAMGIRLPEPIHRYFDDMRKEGGGRNEAAD